MVDTVPVETVLRIYDIMFYSGPKVPISETHRQLTESRFYFNHLWQFCHCTALRYSQQKTTSLWNELTSWDHTVLIVMPLSSKIMSIVDAS